MFSNTFLLPGQRLLAFSSAETGHDPNPFWAVLLASAEKDFFSSLPILIKYKIIILNFRNQEIQRCRKHMGFIMSQSLWLSRKAELFLGTMMKLSKVIAVFLKSLRCLLSRPLKMSLFLLFFPFLLVK